MNKTVVWAIAMKDMRSVISSIRVWLPMLVIPFILGVVAPSIMIIMAGYGNLSKIQNIQLVIHLIENLKGTELHDVLKNYPTLNQKIVYLLITYLFVPCFLVIPIMASSVVAANSFVGEKEKKTLESLLLTPIDMISLFIGKVLSAFIPAMVITMIIFILFGISVNIFSYPLYLQWTFPTWNWILMLCWVVPVISLFVILFNVLISSKVKGFQEAYQLGSVIVIPIAILIVSQLMGYFILSTGRIFMMGAIVLGLDLLILYWVAKSNQRLQLGEKHL